VKLRLLLAAITGAGALAAGTTAAYAAPAGPATGPATGPVTGPATGSVTRDQLVHKIRSATARFHNIATAEAAGYVPFHDVHGVSCIADPGMGGMGVHYVNPKLIDDPAIDPTAPEALVYAPEKDGTLRLAALEYLVPKQTWNAHHKGRPQIFPGKPFDLTTAPNRYGLPTFYSQHVWAWKDNPAGLLMMFNPAVHCPRNP
jgi:hypothetical protein